MLRISVHAGPLKGANRFNQTSWVDIGYDRLAPVADYTVMGFAGGVGASEPTTLPAYPRWSASLWDLASRAIVLLMDSKADPAALAVPAYELGDKRGAFATALCAVIQHRASTGDARVTTLATAVIARDGRTRGMYRAVFEEDTSPRHRTEPFFFKPKFLNPAELLLHAALVRLTGQHEQMPPTPALSVPEGIVVDGKDYVLVHRLIEPARTGFARWLLRCSEPPIAHTGAPHGIAPATMYAKFLQEAI